MTAPADADRPAGRRLGPAERRAQLVGAGLALVKQVPLDGVTAASVADATGVSKALVFHYFPTQRELQAAVAGAAADELLDMIASIDRDLDYVSQLRAGLDGFVTYIEQQPESYAAIARAASADELFREVFERTREAIVDIVLGVLGVSEAQPALRLYLRGWIAMVEETSVQWVLTRAVTHTQLVDFLQASAFDLVARAVGTPLT